MDDSGQWKVYQNSSRIEVCSEDLEPTSPDFTIWRLSHLYPIPAPCRDADGKWCGPHDSHADVKPAAKLSCFTSMSHGIDGKDQLSSRLLVAFSVVQPNGQDPKTVEVLRDMRIRLCSLDTLRTGRVPSLLWRCRLH
jgi:hypothetical protein